MAETSGLSDALSRLAGGQAKPAPPRPAKQRPRPAEAKRDVSLDEVMLADVVEEDEPQARPRGAAVRGRSRPSATPSAARRKGGAKKQDVQLKRFGAWAMGVVGLLVLVPAVWSALVLAGVEVINSDRDGADRIAFALTLVSWPLALILLTGAVGVAWSLRR